MKINDLITQLQHISSSYGNIDVSIESRHKDFTDHLFINGYSCQVDNNGCISRLFIKGGVFPK